MQYFLVLGHVSYSAKSCWTVSDVELFSGKMARNSPKVLYLFPLSTEQRVSICGSRYAGVVGGLSHLINGLTRSFNTPFELRELEAFIESHQDTMSLGQRAFRQSVEKTRASIGWRKRSMTQITKWLENIRK